VHGLPATSGERMRKYLERSIAAIEDRLVLLAPPNMHVPPPFVNVTVDSDLHLGTLREAQRLRGSVYLEDGAISPAALSPDGRHQIPEDDNSWHLLMTDAKRRITACEWYLDHPTVPSPGQLRARHCPLARTEEWHDLLHMAVMSEVQRARRERLRYAEIGGWAVAPSARSSAAGLLLALGGYALARMLGGALMMVTATTRHSSSAILRRLGGASFEFGGRAIPSYFDPRYNCDMELLRFDSRHPGERYRSLVEMLHARMPMLCVIAARAEAEQKKFDDAVRPECAA